MTPQETQNEIERIDAEIKRVETAIENLSSQIDQLKHWQEVQEGADPQ